MKKFVSTYGSTGRRNFLLFLLGALACGVMARIVYLQTSKSEDIITRANDLFTRLVVEPASRGTIADRNNVPLAVSTQVSSIWVNPHQFEKNPEAIRKLAKRVKMPHKKLLQRLKNNKFNSEGKPIKFVYIKRGMPPDEAKLISKAIPGVFTQAEYRRFYPSADVSAQVIGYNDPDQKGLSGVELRYDDWLSGTSGSTKIVRSVSGEVFEILEEINPPIQGSDLRLTLDQRIQYLTYIALLDAVKKHRAKSGTAVMLDARTSEVLAMVSVPSGNPNNTEDRRRDLLKNRAITDLFEPGSVLKPFAIAAALDAGVVTPRTPIDTHPGFINVAHKLVMDVRNYGKLNVTGVIQHSSNVGTCKIVLKMRKKKLQAMYKALGFGQRSQINFPGEAKGIVHNIRRMDDFDYCTNAYGYGISTNVLQIAQAYAVLANGGIKIPVSLETQDTVPKGKRVISARTTRQVLHMLKLAVSTDGTGKGATKGEYISDYTVGGKTGTVHKAIKGGYSKKNYLSVFAGIAPINNPRIVMAIIIDDPKGKKYYGGEVAAPVFAKVAGKTLRLLGVPPDKKNKNPVIRAADTH